MKKGYKRRAEGLKPKRERSNASVNRELSTLRHILNKAIEWEMMERSPFQKARGLFFKENNKRLRFLIFRRSLPIYILQGIGEKILKP
jgi:hypothetical protein